MPVNPVVERMLDENPLIQFSVYTDIQNKIVLDLGQSVLEALMAGIAKDESTGHISCDWPLANRAYGEFWLWILGAYEIVRTMCQAGSCFTPQFARKLVRLKKRLATIRMPFAKQELAGDNGHVTGELSITEVQADPPDLQFEIERQAVSVRGIINEYAGVFCNITRADILADKRTAVRTGR